MTESKLFSPLKVGSLTLQHRVAMAPLTRFRADDSHVPLPFVAEYYAQRASVPGTLLVTEATFIAKENGGYPNVPGIWNNDQIKAWKKVTDAVHEKKSYIYLQLWALGRAASAKVAEQEGFKVKSSSDVPIDSEHALPEPLTIEEIKHTVQNYAQAAKNAVEAGFDGVEVHGANGYLIDQFIQDTANRRSDEYGGSIENRSRFAIEVVKAVTDAIGVERTGIRLSPWSTFQSMRMEDPIPQFTDVITKLERFGLSYLHVVESRVSGNADIESSDKLDFVFDAFSGPILVAGGFKPDSAKRLIDEERKGRDTVVVFGRYFISTPDLVYRLKKGIDLTPYDRDSFYIPKSEKGYIDYKFSDEFIASPNL